MTYGISGRRGGYDPWRADIKRQAIDPPENLQGNGKTLSIPNALEFLARVGIFGIMGMVEGMSRRKDPEDKGDPSVWFLFDMGYTVSTDFVKHKDIQGAWLKTLLMIATDLLSYNMGFILVNESS